MGALDHDDEIELVPVGRDVDDVMFELDVALACDADRHAWAHGSLWGRADLLVDPDGRVRHA
jgi:hypothetical protein